MFFDEKLINEYSFDLLSCKSFYYKLKDISDKNIDKIITNKRKSELEKILNRVEEILFDKFKSYENFNGEKRKIEYVDFKNRKDDFNKIEGILNKNHTIYEYLEQLSEYKNIENSNSNLIEKEKYLFLRLFDKKIRIIFYYDNWNHTLYPLLIDLNHCIIGKSSLNETDIKKLKEWDFKDKIKDIKEETFKKCQNDKKRDIKFKNPFYQSISF